MFSWCGDERPFQGRLKRIGLDSVASCAIDSEWSAMKLMLPKPERKMPKQKTRKSISKRFKLTKTGKVMRRTIGMRHLKANKSKKRSRRQKQANYVTGSNAKKLKKAL